MEGELKRPVRVVHVLEATEGGTRRWLEDVMLGLETTSIENACICALRRAPGFADVLDGFRQRGMGVWTVDMRREIHPWHDLRAVFAIARILRRNSFDIVHAHSAKAGMLARVAALFATKAKVFYTPHAFAFLANGTASGLYRSLEKATRKFTDKLIAVSESEGCLAEELGYGSDSTEVVFNGVDARKYNGCINTNGKLLRIGMIANLRSQKDPQTFIRMCAQLRHKGPDLRFVLYGAGALEGKVRETIEQTYLSCCLDLFTDEMDSRIALKAIDVFVLCSRHEGLPYALLEAMAAAKPIVATRVTGIEEVLVDGKTGLLVPPGDPGALAQAVERLLTDNKLAFELGRAARKHVIEKYRLETQLEKLTELYLTIAKTEKPR